MSPALAAHTVAHIIRKRHRPVWFRLGHALMCEPCDINFPGVRRNPTPTISDLQLQGIPVGI
jgi:hypothetical protein